MIPEKDISIEQFFAIQRDVPDTLTAQLQECFRRFIAENPDGTRVPSARLMAEQLGVTRVTVHNAMKPFLEQGELASRVRQGIFTVKKTIPEPSFPRFHSMFQSSFFIARSIAALNLVLAENIPAMRRFWESTVAGFNRTSEGVPVEIKYLPQDINNEATFREHIESLPADIVQLNVSTCDEWHFDLLPLRGLVPDSGDESDVPEMFHSRIDPAGTLAPIYFCLWESLWNRNFFAMPKLEERFLAGDFDHLMADAAAGVKSGINIAGHIWDYWLLPGVPLHPGERDAEFFRERFRRLEELTRHPDMFIRRQRHPLEVLHNLAAGKGFCYFGLAHFLLIPQEGSALQFASAPLSPAPGCVLPWVSSNLALPRDTRDPETAARFIAYAGSRAVQSELTKTTSLASVLSRVNAEYKPHCRNILRNLQPGNSYIPFCMRLVLDNKNLFYDFLDRRIGAEQAAAKLMHSVIREDKICSCAE